MIWFTLALFVVSFLVVALLAPKPEVENARAQTLDDVNFPRATEDAPIPLILGRVRMKAPNVTWYGNFRTIPITERIKTGLFSKKTVVVGHRYFLTMDLALAMGPGVACREIYVDDKIAWTGNTGGGAVTGIGGVGISFGGYKEGGTMSMGGNFYSGAFDLVNQPVDPIIEGLVGAGNVPAYLGTSHITLDGELGESAQLRKMAFVLECYTNSLGLSNNGRIGDDMNPAEALYQIMTDTWRGMGISPALIDTATLVDIGEVLYTEGNGVSVQVTAEATGKKVVEEILRQIDGVAYQDPATGRIIFKLIREDYDPDLLDIYDEDDIIKIENFSRSGWDEVMAQVKISFPQRDKDSDAVAISQDMATAGMIGRLRSTTIAMPFCYNPTLANEIASRERAQLSVPLFRMTLQMNRNANTLRPGDVFKISWPDYNISELIMRVQEFDFGSLLDGKLVVRCLQDNFALSTTVFLPPPETSWEPPVVDPQPILVDEILEMPRFFMNRVQFPIPDGNAGVIPLALKPSTASSTYDLLAGNVTGDLDVREPQQIVYPSTGTMLLEYTNEEGFANGYDTTTGFTLINVTNGDNFVPAGSEAEAKQGEVGLLYANGEFMAFRGVLDNMDGSWTFTNIYRGLLGTSPKTHPVGTRVWQLTTDMYGLGTLDDLAEDDTLYYKLIDRVGPTADDPDDLVEASQLMARWARRPQRVRNLQLDSVRTDIVIDDLTGVANLSWARSNREATEIAIETDADQVPDISDANAEVYDVEIYAGGVLQSGPSSVGNTGNNVNIDFGATALTGPGEIRVIARWDYPSPTPDVENIDYAWLPVTFDQVVQIVFTDLFSTYGNFSGAELVGVYGLRRRVLEYTGPLIRIRDDFDDSEQDVGQNEVGELAAFTVTGNPYIVTVYDQTTNGLDVTAPNNAAQPLLDAHPFRSGDYAMKWDQTDDILRGPTFNSGSPNAHAIARPSLWFSGYRETNVGADNEWMIAITHDVGVNPTLSPFATVGIVNTTVDHTTAQWAERGTFYTAFNTLQFRGVHLLGPTDASNIGMIAAKWNEDAIQGNAIDWTIADANSMDYTGPENRALEIGNRTDQTLPWGNWVYDFGIGEFDLFTGSQMNAFINAQAKTALARLILQVNDASPPTGEFAQGGSYPSNALNPDHNVVFAFYCDDPTLTPVDISMEFYDIDFPNEVNVIFNGSLVRDAAATSNNAWGSRETFSGLTPVFGWNIITVEQIDSLTFVWGVRDPQVTSAVDPKKKLWASFEGADGDTSYTERSFNKRAFTFNGTAQLDDAQKVFGNTSLFLDGNSDWVSLADDDDWNFGSDQFTIEGHFRWLSNTNTFKLLLGQWSSSGNQRAWGLYQDGSGNEISLALSEDGSTSLFETSAAFTPTLNKWYHIAADFDGATYRLYIDGVVVATSTTLRTIHNSTAELRIGRQAGGTDYFHGYVDEVKVYKGVALYKGDCHPNASEA